MKILLVEPPVSPFDVPTNVFALTPPHHLERLAGALLNGHDVRIFDMRVETDLPGVLRDFRPQLLGTSCVAANSHLAKNLLRQAKRLNPEIRTVLGGHHPSLAPSDCDDPAADFVVVGEGEETLRELAERLESGQATENLDGIACRAKNGAFHVNRPRKLLDLDSLPSAARNLTRTYRERKAYYRAAWRPVDCVISSRGCPHRCRFCGLWKINRGRYRFRSAEKVVAEIEQIAEPYVLFFDDNTLDHPQAARMADLLKSSGLRKKYELYGRADTVAKRPELVAQWREAGLELLLIGLEAVDESKLSSMNKDSSPAINRRAIEVCRDLGIEIVAYFIVDPNFSRDDFRRLSDYVEQNRLTHPVFTILSPFPGTDLYEDVKDRLTMEGYSLCDFYHTVLPTRLPLDEFYDEFLGLYRKAYSLRRFGAGLFRKLSVLSPRMLGMNLRFRKRMYALRGHHNQVGARKFFIIPQNAKSSFPAPTVESIRR
jgi:radical SAM superfamily enzyme YgiQ (UPF0313 family)